MKFDKYFEDAIELDNTPEFIAARNSAVINLNRYVPPKGTKKLIKWEDNIDIQKNDWKSFGGGINE